MYYTGAVFSFANYSSPNYKEVFLCLLYGYTCYIIPAYTLNIAAF